MKATGAEARWPSLTQICGEFEPCAYCVLESVSRVIYIICLLLLASDCKLQEFRDAVVVSSSGPYRATGARWSTCSNRVKET